MRRILFLLTLLLWFRGVSVGQIGQPVSVTPDCSIPILITATNGTAPSSPTQYDNRAAGCKGWVLWYYNNGFSAITLALQSSQDSSGSPAGFVTFAGSTVTGVNPNTTTTSNVSTFDGFYPWVRVQLTASTGSGSVRGYLIGYKPAAPSVGGGSSGPTANVNITQYGSVATTLGQKAMAASIPVVVASDQATFPVTPAANSSVNVNQYGGSATTLGQKVMASSVPVTIASDQGTVPFVGNVNGIQADAATYNPATNFPVIVGGVDLAGSPALHNLFVDPAGTISQKMETTTFNGTFGNPILDSSSAKPQDQAGHWSVYPSLQMYADIKAASYNMGVACNNYAFINPTTASTTEIVPAQTNFIPRICHISFAASGATDWSLTKGTGTNCGTGTTTITGTYKAVTTAVLDFPANATFSGSTASNAICFTQSAAVTTGVTVVYGYTRGF